MVNNFSFNSKTHDFWEVYESIVKFYPIGLRRHQGKGIYFEYPRLKELERIIVENIHDEDNFKKRWVNFHDSIGKELEMEIRGTTYGQAPSFSSELIIKDKMIENCKHEKKLHFSVSLVGNYYQIYGSDSITVREGTDRISYPSVNVITTSPYEEFEEVFKFVERKIKEKYPNHKIIPFRLGQFIIDGLQVRYLDDENCSINKALFNQFLSEKRIKKYPRGDQFYGKEVWEKQQK